LILSADEVDSSYWSGCWSIGWSSCLRFQTFQDLAVQQESQTSPQTSLCRCRNWGDNLKGQERSRSCMDTRGHILKMGPMIDLEYSIAMRRYLCYLYSSSIIIKVIAFRLVYAHAVALLSPFKFNENFPLDVFVPICYTSSDVLTNCLFDFLPSCYSNSKHCLS